MDDLALDLADQLWRNFWAARRRLPPYRAKHHHQQCDDAQPKGQSVITRGHKPHPEQAEAQESYNG